MHVAGLVELEILLTFWFFQPEKVSCFGQLIEIFNNYKLLKNRDINMHPVAKCCSLYCSCVMVSGIIFFAILAVMQSNHNMFLTRGKTDAQINETKNVLYTVMVVNLICLMMCVTGTVIGVRKEKEEEERRRELEIRNAREGIDIF